MGTGLPRVELYDGHPDRDPALALTRYLDGDIVPGLDLPGALRRLDELAVPAGGADLLDGDRAGGPVYRRHRARMTRDGGLGPTGRRESHEHHADNACLPSTPDALCHVASSSFPSRPHPGLVGRLRAVTGLNGPGQALRQLGELAARPSVFGLPQLPPELLVGEDFARPPREVAPPRVPVQHTRVHSFDDPQELRQTLGGGNLVPVGVAEDERSEE